MRTGYLILLTLLTMLEVFHIKRKLTQKSKYPVCYARQNGQDDFLESIFFIILTVPPSTWDPSFLIRDQTCDPCIGSPES